MTHRLARPSWLSKYDTACRLQGGVWRIEDREERNVPNQPVRAIARGRLASRTKCARPLPVASQGRASKPPSRDRRTYEFLSLLARLRSNHFGKDSAAHLRTPHRSISTRSTHSLTPPAPPTHPAPPNSCSNSQAPSPPQCEAIDAHSSSPATGTSPQTAPAREHPASHMPPGGRS